VILVGWCIFGTGSSWHPAAGLATVLLSHEQQVTNAFNQTLPFFHFVDPTWRGDCQYIAFVATTSPPPNPGIDSVGNIGRALVAPPDLVEQRVVPFSYQGGPSQGNLYPRYSLAPMQWLGQPRWLLSWQTAITAQIWVQDDAPNENFAARNKISPDHAVDPNFPEFSNAGVDPTDTDPLNPKRWVVHEQDIPNFDDTVRSLVVPTLPERVNVIAARANNDPTVIHEKPRWSQRNMPGYSRGYVIFHPQSEVGGSITLRRYVAARYAFADPDDPIYPIRVVIEDLASRSTSFPAFSPDGKYVAFELTPTDPVTGAVTGPKQIWVAAFPADPQTASWPIPEDALPPLVWRVSEDDPSVPGAREYMRPSWDSSSKFLTYLRKDGGIWQVAMRRAVPAPASSAPEQLVSIDPTRQHGPPTFSPCPNSCYVAYHRETTNPQDPADVRYQIWMRQVAVPLCALHQ
jgi:hypothetical protein